MELKQALSSVLELNGLKHVFNWFAELLEPQQTSAQGHRAHSQTRLIIPPGCFSRRSPRKLVFQSDLLDTELPICQPSRISGHVDTCAEQLSCFPHAYILLPWISASPTPNTAAQPTPHRMKQKKMLKWVLTTKGLQIPRETVPGGTDFNTSTASAKVALSKHFSFTNTKRSPGKSSPPRSATPPATRELITMAVLLASKGSWEKKNLKKVKAPRKIIF